MSEISDGTTHTYLLGEKYVNPDSVDGSDRPFIQGSTMTIIELLTMTPSPKLH